MSSSTEELPVSIPALRDLASQELTKALERAGYRLAAFVMRRRPELAGDEASTVELIQHDVRARHPKLAEACEHYQSLWRKSELPHYSPGESYEALGAKARAQMLAMRAALRPGASSASKPTKKSPTANAERPRSRKKRSP